MDTMWYSMDSNSHSRIYKMFDATTNHEKLGGFSRSIVA
jgi:hypothetical protein